MSDSPSEPSSSLLAPLERLVAIMSRLRDPVDGCEWDRAQDHASIARYAVEEAYELVDAIERDSAGDIRDELGDLALQVVFHSRIAAEAGRFDLGDVLTAVAEKMERRHPHIFGDAPPGDWETIKAAERRAGADASALAGIAATLPALSRARKLGARAARVGFDWDDVAGVESKVLEELEEIRSAASHSERQEEFGDLLFTLASWSRHMGLDAEAALGTANAKFERRFRALEAAHPDLAALGSAAKERAWQTVKVDQRAAKRDQSASDIRTTSASAPSASSNRSTISPRA